MLTRRRRPERPQPTPPTPAEYPDPGIGCLAGATLILFIIWGAVWAVGRMLFNGHLP